MTQHFKDATAPRFGHSDVIFLSTFSNEHESVLPVNQQQKCLINGICEVVLFWSSDT